MAKKRTRQPKAYESQPANGVSSTSDARELYQSDKQPTGSDAAAETVSNEPSPRTQRKSSHTTSTQPETAANSSIISNDKPQREQGDTRDSQENQPNATARLPETSENSKNPKENEAGDVSNSPGRKNDRETMNMKPGENQPNSENTGEAAMGGIASAVAETATEYAITLPLSLPRAHARDGETRRQCWERLRSEARTAGMKRRDAISYAGKMVEQVWVPPEPEVIEEPEPEEPEAALAGEPFIPLPEGVFPDAPAMLESTSAPEDGVSGLGDLPEAWGELPANASLQAEISWVSANRLRVRDGNGVNLSRALSPAPSYSALSWLETSILFPSKFADISVKATANQDDEKEMVRREKMAIEEIRGLLAEMLAEMLEA